MKKSLIALLFVSSVMFSFLLCGCTCNMDTKTSQPMKPQEESIKQEIQTVNCLDLEQQTFITDTNKRINYDERKKETNRLLL